MNFMLFFFWLVLSYLSGAIPWSVWLGERFFRVDPRKQPDGNPGAANAFRAAGWRLGVSVLLLDFFKAFLPVLVARLWLGVLRLGAVLDRPDANPGTRLLHLPAPARWTGPGHHVWRVGWPDTL